MDARTQLSRRAFLFGRHPAAGAGPVRPPWALPETDFLQACTRCDACVAACPQQVLVRDDDGLPCFRPARGECSFCGDCVRACASHALTDARSRPWNLGATIGGQCLLARDVVCTSCRDVCPEQAIRIPLGIRAGAHVDGERCTGCGACVGACPVDAVSLENREAA